MAKRKDEDQPWIDNYPPLKAWLKGHKAFCQWQLPLGGTKSEPNAYVECWQVGKRQVMLIVHAKQGGWNLYTDCNDGSIEATLLDAEARLGKLGNTVQKEILLSEILSCLEPKALEPDLTRQIRAVLGLPTKD